MNQIYVTRIQKYYKDLDENLAWLIQKAGEKK